MILDSLENLKLYLPEGCSEEVVQFAGSVSSDVADGKRVIREDVVFSRIMTLLTVDRKQGVLESHRSFVDIQIVLAGQEIIEVWPTTELKEKSPYIRDKDVVLYQIPDLSFLRLVLQPGYFAVFFPQDAHMPQIAIAEAAPLRKLVIKVSVTLFQNGKCLRATSFH